LPVAFGAVSLECAIRPWMKSLLTELVRVFSAFVSTHSCDHTPPCVSRLWIWHIVQSSHCRGGVGARPRSLRQPGSRRKDPRCIFPACLWIAEERWRFKRCNSCSCDLWRVCKGWMEKKKCNSRWASVLGANQAGGNWYDEAATAGTKGGHRRNQSRTY